MLIVMMGLPGTGKSAIAEAVARAIGAPVFSVDPIEATLIRAGITREQRSGYAAYNLALMLARSQLELGQSAVVDAANYVEIARAWWRDLAAEFAVRRGADRMCLLGCRTAQAENRIAEPEHRWLHLRAVVGGGREGAYRIRAVQ